MSPGNILSMSKDSRDEEIEIEETNSGTSKDDKRKDTPTIGTDIDKVSKLSTFFLRYLPKEKNTNEDDHTLPQTNEVENIEQSCLGKYNEAHNDLLKKYQEHSSTYNISTYDSSLSEDDISILQPDHDKNFYRKEKRKNYPTPITISSSSSSMQQLESLNKDIEKNENHQSNKSLFLKFANPITNGSHDIVDFSTDRTKIPIRKRLRQRKEQIKEIWKDHKWKNWTLLWSFVVLLVTLCLTIPVLIKFLDHPYGPVITVYEKITDFVYPQLASIRQEMIDPDTPKEALTKVTKNGEIWDLVFSDEFNANGRTFYPGMDQFWEAVDLNYAATHDLEWYDPDAITTSNGTLNIRMDAFKQHDLFYRSGMLQSWNKLCFTEGYLEISAKLPGSAYTGGLWPGLWTLGNLARPGYMASTDGVWPYAYDECDAGITANQSSSDGLSYLPGQRLNKCTCKGEDHPNRGLGRGAPEIDILEGAHSKEISKGVAAQTLQIAPFDVWYQPDYDFVEVYNLSKSNIAPFMGTPAQEMLSTSTVIHESWFQNVVDPDNITLTLEDRQTFFQTYGVEYQSSSKKRDENYLTFFIGNEKTSTVYGNALHPNGNVGWRELPKEPMSVILNLGLSTAWSVIQWTNIVFPVEFQIDYIRLYQPPGKTQLTCDPKEYPTSNYIEKHMNAYTNPNLTTWKDAGYTYPKNKLTGC